jgi:hypothetical protein
VTEVTEVSRVKLGPRLTAARGVSLGGTLLVNGAQRAAWAPRALQVNQGLRVRLVRKEGL